MQQVGKVLWWDVRDREGVIIDALGTEIYFNGSVFSEHTKLKRLEGRFVWFTVDQTIKHINCAKAVTSVPTSAISKVKQTFEKNIKRSPDMAA